MSVTIVLCAGQSNALGQTAGSNLPSNLQTLDSNIKIWNGSAFVTLQNGVNNDITGAGPGTWWGPEAEFARRWRLKHPSNVLYIVKYAVSGTFLYDTGSLTWFPTPRNGPSYFATLKTYTDNAKTALSGLSPIVEAFLWMQGESDGSGSDQGGLAVANEYQTNLTALFSAVRSQLGDNNTKIVVGRITDSSHWPSGSIIRAAQTAVVSGDSGISSLVDTDTFLRLVDDFHYNADGLVSLGSSMYGKFEIPQPSLKCRFGI